jgi:CheY-like chemotaxis protein
MQQSHNRKIATTFQQILTAGDHLLHVVNDVLDLSKLDAGGLTIVAEPFDVCGVANQCVDMFRVRAESKGLGLSVQVSDDLPVQIEGDRFRVQQVLINLLGNAVKFTDVGEVGLRVYRESDQVCYRVYDSGVGLAPDQVKQLFKPYFQTEDADRRSEKGTGLGLTISRRIAALMGGDIRVQSHLGVGSEFTLRLPLIAASKTRMTSCSPKLPAEMGDRKLTGLRVLLADDVAINRSVVEHLLNLEGAQVETAENGGEVIDVLALGGEAEFDVILMDVEMPGMGGREATRRIREAGIAIPVIGVTAHVSAEERQASLLAGMQDQLVKPLVQETLVTTILNYVDPPRQDSSGPTTLH